MAAVGVAAGIAGTAADAIEVVDCKPFVCMAVGSLVGARILLVAGVLGQGYAFFAVL